MNTLNIPNVRKITGRAMMVIIGLIKAFINPITVPAIKRSIGEPEKTNPGKYLLESKIATQLAIIISDNFIELVIA
jgi:hypothetical protein